MMYKNTADGGCFHAVWWDLFGRDSGDIYLSVNGGEFLRMVSTGPSECLVYASSNTVPYVNPRVGQDPLVFMFEIRKGGAAKRGGAKFFPPSYIRP